MKSSVTIALVPSIKTGPWIYWNDLATSMEKAAKLGFDAVELFISSADAIDQDELQTYLIKQNLKLSAIGTGAGKVIHGLTLTDPNPEIRAKAIDFISDIIAFGANFGASAIIGSMQGNVAWGATKDQALHWLSEGLNELGSFASSKGVKLIYEPLNRYETNLINDLSTGSAFLGSLKSSNVFLLADLFHMNIEEEYLAQSIRLNAAYIGHVHLADSNRRPAGMGHIQFSKIAGILKEIGYKGYVSAEALPYPDSDAAAQQTIMTFNQYFK